VNGAGTTAASTSPSIRSDRGSTGPDWLTIAAAVGAGVNAGMFYSWSAMVMPAVGELPTGEGISAMQELNSAAPAPFTVAAFGTAALCAVLIIRAFGVRGTVRGRWVLVGATLFLTAAIVVTFAVNVPLSYAIDQLTPAETSNGEWGDLHTGWVWANHLRTLGCVAAAAALTVAACRPSEPSVQTAST
jgi:uncharacterized membrane protein